MQRILAVSDLGAFQRFVQLVAGRSGQLLNASAVADDAGIVHNTATAWLGVLETAYLIARVPAYHRSVGKRLVKAPRLCFVDSGLLCYLLGSRTAEELGPHPYRGAVFESWVDSEIIKARARRGLAPDASCYRDRHGTEVDAVVEADEEAILVEAMVGSNFFGALDRVAPLVEEAARPRKVACTAAYGGKPGRRGHTRGRCRGGRVHTAGWA